MGSEQITREIIGLRFATGRVFLVLKPNMAGFVSARESRTVEVGPDGIINYHLCAHVVVRSDVDSFVLRGVFDELFSLLSRIE